MNYRTLLLTAAAIPVIVPQAVHAAEADSSTATEMHLPGAEIIVTASGLDLEVSESATPVISLSGDELVQRRQATLGDTLAGQPGVSFDNFGGGASRPVIRGQAAPRVQVLSDAANIQDASTISPDHAVVAEPLLLRGIEVLRGPAALLYGGGAIGGAINLLDSKVPVAQPEGGIEGGVEGRLGTADDERSIVGGLTAGVGPFVFRVEGVHRSSDDYSVPDAFDEGEVHGSYNETSTFSAGGSWIGEDGYLGMAYTRQRSEYGLPGHTHEYEDCHPHGTSLHCGTHDHGDDDHDHDHGDDHEEVPFVKLRSERFDIRGEYRDLMPGIDKIRFRMAITDYEHDELEHEEVATTFKNEATDVRFDVMHSLAAGIRGVAGIQYSESDFSALGEEAFIVPAETTNTALFLMETASLGPVRIELAARQEWQKVKPVDSALPEAEYDPFSISGAAIWEFTDGYSVALSLARSQRAPSVQELYARGIHLATNTYEIGMIRGASLPGAGAFDKEETAKSVNLTFRKTAGPTTFTIGAYHQDFDNYIYAETLDRFEDFRLIRYIGADATFTGVDGEIRHEFTPNFAASVFGDYVRAKLEDDGGNLPRIPAGRLGGRVDGNWGPFSGDLEYYHVFEQDKIADFETTTPGYDMLNATLAYRLKLGTDGEAQLFVRGTNLTNELAFNHSSFIKNASPLRGRNVVFGLRTEF